MLTGHRRTAARSLARAAALTLAAAAVTGCAARQKTTAEAAWPLPPDKPRLKYVATIVGPSSLRQGAWDRLVDSLFGGDLGMNVFNPSGLALSADETRLYVTCPPIARVLEFDFTRRSVREVATAEGHRPSHPYGIATDAQDRLYVGDQRQGVVHVYSRKNDFLLAVGKGLLVRPTGVSVDPRRQLLYVVDPGTREHPRHVVEVFALDGRHLRTIGAGGTKPGEFYYPNYAWVAKDGKLYVADTLNSRVQIFDPDGNLMTTFGSLGDSVGQFGKPKSVAVDAAGNIHVTDGQTGIIQVFDPNLRVLMLYAGRADAAPYLLLPAGIVINSKNEIFVADYSAHKINKYVLFDTSAPEPEKGTSEKPVSEKPSANPPSPASSSPAAPSDAKQ